MYPILCIGEPSDTEIAKELREAFPSEYVIINGVMFMGLDGEDGYLKDWMEGFSVHNTDDPDDVPRFYARIDRSLFPKKTSLQLPEWIANINK